MDTVAHGQSPQVTTAPLHANAWVSWQLADELKTSESFRKPTAQLILCCLKRVTINGIEVIAAMLAIVMNDNGAIVGVAGTHIHFSIRRIQATLDTVAISMEGHGLQQLRTQTTC